MSTREVAGIRRLTESILKLDSSHSVVPTIYLPNRLNPEVSTDAESDPAIWVLLEACQSRGIQVHFVEFEDDYGATVIPRAFLEYAKERKARMEAEQAAEGQQ
ncbi:hypothetical protein JCM8547_007939 [Rhodosporidiobolus lusitaniae]